MKELLEKIEKRRTFAIISHPDAGKTTLTEKLLLYGGAIHLAGSVKARKSNKHAVSDWMEIEKQRGISVTSSVLQFDYDGYRVNILDTPGHQDFSEDTYRTLMAADSAVMLIDAAKGIEPQTKKLFWVCHRRHLPIFTFVNKLDRYGRNPFDLMDELEKILHIRAFPINWPIGIDGHYKGVYNRLENTIELFEEDGSHGAKQLKSTTGSLDDPKIREMLGEELYENLCNDIELLDMAGDEFDMEKVKAGELTPMFFGSAMTNFGVRAFLEKFLELSPKPQPRALQDGTMIMPDNEKFSAFIFKIQANMNPAHRDRISFMRICSGVFDKGMSVYHKQGGKLVKLAQPQQFLAQERTIVEKAYPGDIIGVFDPGIFGIGDSLSDNSMKLQFEDFPVFPPEIFARVQPKDSLKRKQFEKGIMQLSQEGAIQVFKQEGVGLESCIVGVVGVLQLEVLEYRLLNEYSAQLLMNQLPYSVARWVYAEDKKLVDNIKGLDNGMLVYDKKDRPVILVNNEWSLNWILERNPGIQFLTVPADVEKSKPEEKPQDLYQYNVDKKFSLSQQIVILIVLVVGVALLPASIFTTQRVAKVIYDRVSINAVSINNILCNSEEVKSVLQMQNMLPDGAKNTDADERMMAYVNEVDNSDEAAVAIYDKHMQLRGLYNPRGLKGFEESAHALVEEYAPKRKISWRDNYAIPNKALGFVRDDDTDTTIGYVVTGYSDDTLNKSTIDSVMFLMLMTFLGILMGVVGAIFLASRIKAVLFGYEPEEIARLLQERNIILDSVREGIITINSAGIITMVNDEAHQLLKQSGIDKCDKLCNSPSKLIFDDPRLEEVTRDGKSFFDASSKIGKTVFIVTAVPLVFQKNVIGAVITFRKKSVVEEMANQLTGFKNYATALRAQTHEFMNKMHVIMGLIDMKAYDELKNFTQEIAYNRQSEVSYIVTRMRDITLSGFILGKISRSRELQIDFSMTEESELHSDLEVPSVHDIVLIAGNFVENAFDVLKNYDGERIVNLTILDFDKEIVIIVEDSGPGMTEEVMSKMFDRGFSTKDGNDRGFGLYLVKQSVDNLNGTITVDSALGEGTTFTVRLPMKKEGKKMINVLVVEDDPMVAQLHEHYLSQIKGFQLCDIAGNGDAALKLLRQKKYDLLILDVFMPTMDGLSLLAKIRENEYDVDVIIVSAANDKDKIKQALRLGAVDYIIKPFEFERFNLALCNYQKRYHIVETQNVIEQAALDQTIIRHDESTVANLPKGLDKNTLATVWECIRSIDGIFTTEEVAAMVGISRVSIRKYLEFLKSLHLLKLDLHRGSVGRPVYKYLCLDKQSDILKAYIQ